MRIASSTKHDTVIFGVEIFKDLYSEKTTKPPHRNSVVVCVGLFPADSDSPQNFINKKTQKRDMYPQAAFFSLKCMPEFDQKYITFNNNGKLILVTMVPK